jgi:hypothetical protein
MAEMGRACYVSVARGGTFIRQRRALGALSALVAGPVLTPPSLFPVALRPCRLFLFSVLSLPCACSGSACAFLFFKGSTSAACPPLVG